MGRGEVNTPLPWIMSWIWWTNPSIHTLLLPNFLSKVWNYNFECWNFLKMFTSSFSPSSILLAKNSIVYYWLSTCFSIFHNFSTDIARKCFASSIMLWHEPKSNAKHIAFSLTLIISFKVYSFNYRGTIFCFCFSNAIILSCKLLAKAWALCSNFNVSFPRTAILGPRPWSST